MRMNVDELVSLSVGGRIISAVWPANRAYRIGGDGVSRVLPGTGGICYSHQIGDSAMRLKGDHVEPGVSLKAANGDDNSALNTLSCIGNVARVTSGPAEGARGVVTGKHGGVDHVMVSFPSRVLSQLRIGDAVQIEAVGVGLELSGWRDGIVMNCDPRLIKALDVELHRGQLRVPVTHILPAAIMGSGLGSSTCYAGDYDIQTFDQELTTRLKLNELRFGDIVAISDADHSYGRRYLGGAVSIGVIVHSRSDMSGHGPGVTTLFTSPKGTIVPRIEPTANIGRCLGIGRWWPAKAKRPSARQTGRRSTG